jgi:protein TonB
MKRLFILFLLLGSAFMTNLYAQGLEPRFPGCDKPDDYDCADMKMMQFIFSNMKVPDAAKAAGVNGTVTVAFKVGTDGAIKGPSIKTGLGSGCDEEVIRVVQMMPKWLPATGADGAVAEMDWEIEVKIK